MRRRALLVVLLGALVACGGDDTAATTTTRAATTTSTAATTASTAATTTTTTIDPAKLKSDDKVALALNQTLLTTAELDTPPGPPPGVEKHVAYTGTAANPAPPQGPLSFEGVAAIFPSPVYRDPLTKGKASVGANTSFQAIVTGGQPGPVGNILAIKFESGETAKAFVETATAIAIQIGQAKQTDHPEVSIGILPGLILRVPPGPQDDPPLETLVTAALYDNGVYYLLSILAPPGAIPDDIILAELAAQDAKYKALKDSLGL